MGLADRFHHDLLLQKVLRANGGIVLVSLPGITTVILTMPVEVLAGVVVVAATAYAVAVSCFAYSLVQPFLPADFDFCDFASYVVDKLG